MPKFGAGVIPRELSSLYIKCYARWKMLRGGNRIVQGAWKYSTPEVQILHTKILGRTLHTSVMLTHKRLKAKFSTK
jgi:hypothetical protein